MLSHVMQSETIKYLASKSLQADDDCVEILFFPQIDRLEKFLRRHSECLGSFQEVVDVLHALESHLAHLDAFDGVGLNHVGQPCYKKIIKYLDRTSPDIRWQN